MGGRGGFSGAESFSDVFGDVFGDIFGGGGGRQQRSSAQRGSDLRYNLELTLEEAVAGTDAKVRIPVLVAVMNVVVLVRKKALPSHLYDLSRPRPSQNATRILFGAANLPDL